MTELVVKMGALAPFDAMRLSRSALDAPLEGDAELTVLELTGRATVLGAFQRDHALSGSAADAPVTRRGSGGPFVMVGPGTLHVLLALSHPAALTPCDAGRLINRYVRPLLRALTKSGALAHYFGRDWVSVAHRPVAQVGFAHDSGTGRATFEAFVAVAHPFAPSGRASFRNTEPGTLASVTGGDYDLCTLGVGIARSYAKAFERGLRDVPVVVAEEQGSDDGVRLEPPWAASANEAIGEVAAGRDADGVFRLGGDLVASRDALDRVARRVAALSHVDDAAVGLIVDEELTSPAMGLLGVQNLDSIRRVIVEAWPK